MTLRATNAIRGGVIAAVLASVAVVLPATARADEAGFLDRVHAAQIPLTDDKALKLGRAACIDLSKGIPVSAVLTAQNPGVGDGPHLTGAQNWHLLSSAISALCPEVGKAR
jgi:Protein of unknown function (DUF732)